MIITNHPMAIVTVLSIALIIYLLRVRRKRDLAENPPITLEESEQKWLGWVQTIGFDFPVLLRDNSEVPEASGFQQLMQLIGDPDIVCYDNYGESILIDVNGKIISLQFNESKREIYPVKIIDHKETPQELLTYLEPIIKNMLSAKQYELVTNMSSVPDIITYLSATLE